MTRETTTAENIGGMGITVNATVTIDPSQLGAYMAAQGSDSQAAFFAGFAQGVAALGPLGGPTQLAWIAAQLSEDFTPLFAQATADTLRAIADSVDITKTTRAKKP